MLGHDNFVELQWNDEIVIIVYLKERGGKNSIQVRQIQLFPYVIISMARRIERETRSRATRRVLIDLINVYYDEMEILFVIRVISLDLYEHYKCMSEACVLEIEMKSKLWLNIYK